ncbi:hypothetical protein SDC9_82858 [bioreactor metagenome]|uniref:Uncharacterized protein n=1 Tax=bioreactor metagenome TaxID=1076179 RepID=A0A644ZC22_9ZZZZ
MIRFFLSIKRKLYTLKIFASVSAMINFINSAGCNRTGPITNHEREPLISGATTRVMTNNAIPAM